MNKYACVVIVCVILCMYICVCLIKCSCFYKKKEITCSLIVYVGNVLHIELLERMISSGSLTSGPIRPCLVMVFMVLICCILYSSYLNPLASQTHPNYSLQHLPMNVHTIRLITSYSQG